MTSPTSRRWLTMVGLALGAVLLVLPIGGNGYQLAIATLALIWVTMAIGLQIIFGYGGLLSVAHGGLFGLAAYATGILSVTTGWPVWLTGIIAIVVTMIVSAGIGAISVRASGMSFAVLTLAFGAILYELFLNLTEVTGGPLGVVGIPPLPRWSEVIGNGVRPPVEAYVSVAVIVVAALLVFWWLIRSEFGRALVCTREDETLAASFGINVRRVRRWAFVVSAGFAALAGVLFAHYFQFIAPESFTFLVAFQAIVMVVAGGAGTFLGTIVGAVGLSLLPELLRDVSQFQQITYGIILFLAIRFLPMGVVGWAREKLNDRALRKGAVRNASA